MLRDRILTALALGAVLLAVLLWMPPWATLALLTLAVLAGAWEWSGFLGGASVVLRVAYVALIGASLPLVWIGSSHAEGQTVILLAGVVFWLFAFVQIVRAPPRVSTLVAALAGLLVLAPLWLVIARLRVDVPHGALWIVFMIVMVGAADTGAYFAGRAFGKVRLAPRVSPGKTWEGALGGLAAALVVALVGGLAFDAPLAPFVALCAGVIAFSIVGDLTESLFKRSAGLKDSGSLLKGHGGVLDRIDSLTAGAPVLLLGLRALGVAP